MPLLIALFGLLLNAPSSEAAAGFRCVTTDFENSYISSGRFADWGKIHSTGKCEGISQDPSTCQFRGCQKTKISNALAQKSDRNRVAVNRSLRAPVYVARAPRVNPREAAAQDRAADELNAFMNRQMELNAIRNQTDELRRLREQVEELRNKR
ncbi:MAG: hypothetical protein EOP11_15210 [Proteobacteria bacterium]|nr:MAG: hypothetical protein EOP11_15210 [Pseudomonadota bacterium]